MNARGACGLILLATLSGCEPESFDAEPPHSDWVTHSHVVFYSSDGKTVEPPPKEPVRLWVPYVVGDIYGSPNEGEIQPVDLKPDMSFTLNLNLGHLKLEKMLVPTQFSQKWMSIEPKEARVARLSPFVLPAKGIAPLGVAEWLDEETHDKLMLVYIDRPARVRGEIVYEGRNLRFDIEAKEANGFTALSQAGSVLHWDTVDVLIQAGAACQPKEIVGEWWWVECNKRKK